MTGCIRKAGAPRFQLHKYQRRRMMIRTVGLALALITLVIAACGGAEKMDFAPGSVAQEQPGFLFLYTDN